MENGMEDSFTYVSRLHEEEKLKQIKNEVLDDLKKRTENCYRKSI